MSEDIRGDNETQTLALINILVPVAAACVIAGLLTLYYLRRHHLLTTTKLHGLTSHARQGDKRFHHIHQALEEMNSGEFTVIVPDPGDDSVGFAPVAPVPPPPPSASPPHRSTASSEQASGEVDPNAPPAELLAHVRERQAQRKQSVALTFRRATVLPTAAGLIGSIDEDDDDRASLMPHGSKAAGRSLWKQKTWKKTLQREQGVLAQVERMLEAHETNLASQADPAVATAGGVGAKTEAAKLRVQFQELKERHDSDLEKKTLNGTRRISLAVGKRALKPGAAAAHLALRRTPLPGARKEETLSTSVC